MFGKAYDGKLTYPEVLKGVNLSCFGYIDLPQVEFDPKDLCSDGLIKMIGPEPKADRLERCTVTPNPRFRLYRPRRNGINVLTMLTELHDAGWHCVRAEILAAYVKHLTALPVGEKVVGLGTRYKKSLWIDYPSIECTPNGWKFGYHEIKSWSVDPDVMYLAWRALS